MMNKEQIREKRQWISKTYRSCTPEHYKEDKINRMDAKLDLILDILEEKAK